MKYYILVAQNNVVVRVDVVKVKNAIVTNTIKEKTVVKK